MPKNYRLTQQELDDLQFEHRHTSNKRYADRIKTVYLLGTGWSVTKVAEALMIDRETVRNHYKRYRKGGLPALLKHDAGGSEASLNDEQLQQLSRHLQENLYQTAKEIAHYIEQTWQISYSESGLSQLLHRIGFVYKKPKLVPGKADAEKQRAFVVQYQELKASKAPEDPIYFMDATHPHHNPIAGYGWIKRGQDHEIRSNTGRQRININGVIDTVNLQSIVRYDDTINAQSTVLLFKQIEEQNPEAGRIHIICDNARYYRSKLVQEYLLNSRIDLIFLPPYAPNLNLIERFWKFFKKKILYGKYYETFCAFKNACDEFFAQTDRYRDALLSLLTDNFQIIGST
ncbi:MULTISPECIES: IS630 family transposase [Methylobacter]